MYMIFLKIPKSADLGEVIEQPVTEYKYGTKIMEHPAVAYISQTGCQDCIAEKPEINTSPENSFPMKPGCRQTRNPMLPVRLWTYMRNRLLEYL